MPSRQKVYLRSAEISPCEKYRYVLTRELSADPKQTVLFALLNPSTADSETDDPTCSRCIGFTWFWGYERTVIVNTNPDRNTDPKLADEPPEPVLIINDEFARVAAANADLIVCAWGANAKPELAERLIGILETSGKQLHHMGLTRSGIPSHPLYLHSRTQPKPWEERAA